MGRLGTCAAPVSSAASSMIVVWRVPECSATSWANGSSWLGRKMSGLNSSWLPGKSTEKVASLPSPSRASALAARAVSALESSPPDSSVHSGTSATS